MFWRLRTAAMFIFLSLLLMLLGTIVFALLNLDIYTGLIVMAVLSFFVCVIMYFSSKGMALRANGARLVTETEEPRLYRTVRSVSQMAGIPMPDVGVTESPMPNAFAAGRNPKNAVIVATRGLLNTLNDEELEGVIAHEAAHIKNRDILVMTVAAGISAVITVAARFTFLASLFRGDDRNPWLLVVALLAYITFPIAAVLIQLGISRKREYLADESAAKYTGRPLALASALETISRPPARVGDYDLSMLERDAPVNTAHMWISPPPRKEGLLKTMFSTHPPMEDRIARLRKMAGVL
ncbi:MAG: M48 family metalloprotease [Thermoplasmatales archaeon]|nr:M48 family metalloprotease [Thermoplasmatales archaeon]